MKTPRFWQSENPLSLLLSPLGMLYDTASKIKRSVTTPHTLGIPVICIGNLTVGGSGKTPTALYVGEQLKKMGVHAFFLSKGYGGKLCEPTLVDSARHSARDVGDEPLLLARCLPTVIARNRVDGARFAIAQGAKAIVMDDGFQNPTLAKTLSFLVVDGEYGFGNGKIFPAGPLREKPADGFARAQAIILINKTNAAPTLPAHLPLFEARIAPAAGTPSLAGERLIAFCGLAHPQKFFATLRALQADLIKTISYADHYFYSERDLNHLLALAAQNNARLITTAKDAVRLPPEVLSQVIVLDISLVPADEEKLARMLKDALGTV